MSVPNDTIVKSTPLSRNSVIWLVVVLGVLSTVRFSTLVGEGPYGLDASYYFQIARNVEEGRGLTTTASLYHEGLILPARSSVYPLWPLLLGYSGRLIGLVRAANVLPPLFYILDLALLYFVIGRITGQVGGIQLLPHSAAPDIGHLLVMLFGLNPSFFAATTHPYTEGLAFAVAFAAFLALESYDRTGSSRAAGAAGGFAALAVLARLQMVGVGIGIGLALLLARRWRALTIFALAAAVVVTPWILFLGYIPGLSVVPAWNPIPKIPMPLLQAWSSPDSVGAWLTERAVGIGTAFNPASPYSYLSTFGPAAVLAPLAVLPWLVQRPRGRTMPVAALALMLCGMFLFLNLTLYHDLIVWLPWLFGWRHGLPLVFLLAVALPFIARFRVGRIVAALLLVGSIGMGAIKVSAAIHHTGQGFSAGERQLLKWLDSRNATTTIITTNAQVLSAFSRVHAHWTVCSASPETTELMMRSLPIDYIVLYEGETRCRFVAGLREPLLLTAMFGEPGRRLFVLRPMAPKEARRSTIR